MESLRQLQTSGGEVDASVVGPINHMLQGASAVVASASSDATIETEDCASVR